MICTRSYLVSLGVAFSIVVCGWGMTGCATTESMASTPRETPDDPTRPYLIPTPVGAAFFSQPLDPTPTIETYEQFVQQSSAPRVSVGRIALVEPTPTPVPRYTVRDHKQKSGEGHLIRITDSVTGQEVELGEKPGYTVDKARNDRYVIWGFVCQDCRLHTGLYAYDLINGRQITLSHQGSGSAYPEIDGDWVLYQTIDPETYVGTVHVHHLISGEAYVIEDALHTRGKIVVSGEYLVLPSHVYDISGTLVAWAEADVVHVYDLTTHTTRTLDVPPIVTEHIRRVGVSDGVVVWKTLRHGWWGYDLDVNALFKIHLGIPGWKQVAGSLRDMPTVRDGHMFWSSSIDMLEGPAKPVYFKAPLVREE